MAEVQPTRDIAGGRTEGRRIKPPRPGGCIEQAPVGETIGVDLDEHGGSGLGRE